MLPLRVSIFHDGKNEHLKIIMADSEQEDIERIPLSSVQLRVLINPTCCLKLIRGRWTVYAQKAKLWLWKQGEMLELEDQSRSAAPATASFSESPLTSARPAAQYFKNFRCFSMGCRNVIAFKNKRNLLKTKETCQDALSTLLKCRLWSIGTEM